VASLAAVPVPAVIAVGGMLPCDKGYHTGTNTLLDVIVHGCSFMGTGVFNATQPDPGLVDSSVTLPAGTKAPYTLSASTATLVVDTCTDGSTPAKPVLIATCLKALAYSSAFQYQTDRVIMK
jgi:hypothetical protein